MPPNVSLGFVTSNSPKPFVKVTESVRERSGFPPKPPKSVTNSVTGRSSFPPEKLVKQLVFTEFGLSPVSSTMHSTEKLLLSPAKPYYLSPHLPPRSPFSALKSESPIKANGGATKDRKRCHCKKSRCLKLYCECFAVGAYCDGCNCNCCRNNLRNEALRKEAAEIILERNPIAFKPKINRSPHSYKYNGHDAKDAPKIGKHNRGCHCKKIGCLKKYCECFQAEVLCSENCKCVDCKNYEGCGELMALSGKEYDHTQISEGFEGCEETMAVSCGYNSLYLEGCEKEMVVSAGDKNHEEICFQQATASISTALELSGPSFPQAYRKRKHQEFLDLKYKDTPLQGLTNDQKENPPSFSGPSPTLPASSVNPIANVSSAKLESSKSTCRSLLTDVIHSKDPKELCSVLVFASEAAKILAEKNGVPDVQVVRDNLTALLEVHHKENWQEESHFLKEAADDHFRGIQPETMNTEIFLSGDVDTKEVQASSLGTIALTYNEKDNFFMGASNSPQILNCGCNADVYAKQERQVLAIFRDYLTKLIALGNMKDQHDVDNPIVNTDITT